MYKFSLSLYVAALCGEHICLYGDNSKVADDVDMLNDS